MIKIDKGIYDTKPTSRRSWKKKLAPQEKNKHIKDAKKDK